MVGDPVLCYVLRTLGRADITEQVQAQRQAECIRWTILTTLSVQYARTRTLGYLRHEKAGVWREEETIFPRPRHQDNIASLLSMSPLALNATTHE